MKHRRRVHPPQFSPLYKGQPPGCVSGIHVPSRATALGGHDDPAPVEAEIVIQAGQEVICFGEEIWYDVVL